MAYAEGLETALSVAEAHPEWNVHVTFGVNNFAKVPLKTDVQSIVLCIDNDGIESGTAKTVHKSAHSLAAQGKDVYVALPPKPEHIDKYDFNDMLKHEGKEAVRASLDNRTLYKAAVTAESLKNSLKEVIDSGTEQSNHLAQPNPLINESALPPSCIEDILLTFNHLQTEQFHLTGLMHEALGEDRLLYLEAKKAALSKAEEVTEFAQKALTEPSVKAVVEARGNEPIETIEALGGLSAIEERLRLRQATPADINTLTFTIERKVSSAKRELAKTQDRDRSGRRSQ